MTCPDCSGTLKLEPPWARPSRDLQLTRLDEETKQSHRRARDLAQTEAARAAAWTEVDDHRRRYEALRRRLLPALEVAEARRVERIEAGARGAGIVPRAYEAKLAQEEREREQAREVGSKEALAALDAGTVDQKEYRRRVSEVWARYREQCDLADRAAAQAEGLSLVAYRSREARERRERQRLWGDEDTWLGTDSFGLAELIQTILAVPIVLVVGLVLTVVFLLVGRQPLAAIAGTLLGGLGGWILALAVFSGALAIVEVLERRSWVVRRVIAWPSLTVLYWGIFVVPPVLVVAVALWFC
jgi:hypothetical protein